MGKPQPDPELQPSQAIASIHAEIEKYSEAIGLADLITSLTAEAAAIRGRISDLETEYAHKLKTGQREIDEKLQIAQDKAEVEKRGFFADITRARNDLKLLLREIEETKAAEEDRIEDLRVERIATQAARKALAAERAAFDGDQRRLSRSSR